VGGAGREISLPPLTLVVENITVKSTPTKTAFVTAKQCPGPIPKAKYIYPISPRPARLEKILVNLIK